jgi:hypothetical protein
MIVFQPAESNMPVISRLGIYYNINPFQKDKCSFLCNCVTTHPTTNIIHFILDNLRHVKLGTNNCERPVNEIAHLKSSVLKVGKWPVSKSELTNRCLKQLLRSINSIDLEKINHM